MQEDNPGISSGLPESQVVAEAIAAFQYNNRVRDILGKPLLEQMTIPCITMLGTKPVFYKVPVTKALSDAVISGQFPDQPTVVSKRIVSSGSRRLSEGMETPAFRKIALQHYVAFRALAKSLSSKFMRV